MTTLTIEDSTYQRLRALAAARRLSLDAYLNEIAGLNHAPMPSDSTRQLAAIESFAAGMKAWTNNHLLPGYIADDSRESIYEDGGE